MSRSRSLTIGSIDLSTIKMILDDSRVSDSDRTQFLHVLAESLNSDRPDSLALDQPIEQLQAWADVFTLLAAAFHDAVSRSSSKSDSHSRSPRSTRSDLSPQKSGKRTPRSEMSDSDVFTIDEVIFPDDV
jgi:hypothetical protein